MNINTYLESLMLCFICMLHDPFNCIALQELINRMLEAECTDELLTSECRNEWAGIWN